MSERTADKPRHLGKGLEALLGPIKNHISIDSQKPSAAMDPTDGREVRTLKNRDYEVPLQSISVNPYQARTDWNEEKLNELAESIAANGIVQPIVVRQTPTGFQLIAGERRFRACQKLGRETIPVVVREVSDEQMFELSLVENIHRSDLNPVERAKAYQAYISQFDLTQTEAASRLGEDRSVLSNYLRILELPIDVQRLLVGGQLKMGHAKAILALPTEEQRRKLANRALAGRLSVRELERLVSEGGEGKTGVPKVYASKPAHIKELEGKLASHLGTRVSIKTRRGGHRGSLVIDFKSLDEFDTLVKMMGMQFDQEL